MKHSELEDLLGAYALDAVDDDERVEIEAHLGICPRCRAEVEGHREAASLLAFGGTTAPEGVWARITASLEQPPPDLQLILARNQRWSSQPRFWRRLAVTVGAAAAVLVAVLGVQVANQDRRIEELQTALQDPLVPAFQAALENPDSQVIELTSADGAVSLPGAVTGDGVGYLRASPLPALEAGRVYQLWGGAGDRLISLGVLGPDPRIVTFRAHQYALFAITNEEAPGVVVTANPPVVAGTTA